MLNKLELAKNRYDKLRDLIADPDVISHTEEWAKYCKEYSDLEPLVILYNEYTKTISEENDCKEMLLSEDKSMAEIIKEELEELKTKKQNLEESIKLALLPKDPDDDKNVVIEIRSGAGGDEAALFAGVVTRMYKRFAERQKWSVEDIEVNETDLGGIKEITFVISGKNAYSKLKYESGVHRVQRVPDTESQGRLHTSTITVAVLPEIETVEVNIQDQDIRIDTYRASGAGGQHVNKTESAIRITHAPTGIVVTCQDEKSQTKNREKAMKVLASRLYDHYQQEQNKKYSADRKMQIGTGDRSERIRTYNYPQGRVTDHRITFTLYTLSDFLDGDIYSMIEQLQVEDQKVKLSSVR